MAAETSVTLANGQKELATNLQFSSACKWIIDTYSSRSWSFLRAVAPFHALVEVRFRRNRCVKLQNGMRPDLMSL